MVAVDMNLFVADYNLEMQAQEKMEQTEVLEQVAVVEVMGPVEVRTLHIQVVLVEPILPVVLPMAILAELEDVTIVEDLKVEVLVEQEEMWNLLALLVLLVVMVLLVRHIQVNVLQ